MKALAKSVCLFLAFFIDVHLKAAPVTYPAKCWGVTYPCSIGVEGGDRKETIKVPNGKLVLSHAAAMTWLAPRKFEIASGLAFVHHSGTVEYKTPFGGIRCASCTALLQKTGAEVRFHVLNGGFEYKPLGESRWLLLPPGFMAYMGKVGPNGRADVDFPQASPLKVVLKLWAKVYDGDKDQFEEDAKSYLKSWRQAVQVASQLQSKVVEREIASARSHAQRAREHAAAEKREDQRLREMFRQKNGLDVNP